MTSVSVLELARKVMDLLGVREGDAIDLSKLRDGSVLIRRADASQT